jgi:hypothetical protein
LRQLTLCANGLVHRSNITRSIQNAKMKEAANKGGLKFGSRSIQPVTRPRNASR